MGIPGAQIGKMGREELCSSASNAEKGALLQEAMDLLCESNKEGIDEDEDWDDSLEMDDLISRVRSMLKGEGTTEAAALSFSPEKNESDFQELNDYFNTIDQETEEGDRRDEFHRIEKFVLKEQNVARKERKGKRRKSLSFYWRFCLLFVFAFCWLSF